MLFAGAHSLGSSEKDKVYDVKQVQITAANLTRNTIPEKDTLYLTQSVITKDSTAINAFAHKYDVVYTRADGNQFRRSGGTRAWRNNNPGCLRYSEFTVNQGAIGHAGGFAVFPDEETGMRAICSLLKSDKYKVLTISQAVSTYAPPHENDTETYDANLRKMTGLAAHTKLNELNDNQIMRVAKAIKIVEGWRPGQETVISKQSIDSLNAYANAQQQLILKSNQHII